ncbi:MAG: algA [Sphingobacteriales bacterium]|nr:algA [Sphingobacteriales bacterium]
MKVCLEQALTELMSVKCPFKQVMKNGTMTVEIYKPDQVDLQQPHTQDEIYIIISGTGNFYNNGIISEFKPLDVLFVLAGVEHQFQNFTDDFTTWVIFYGEQAERINYFFNYLAIDFNFKMS